MSLRTQWNPHLDTLPHHLEAHALIHAGCGGWGLSRLHMSCPPAASWHSHLGKSDCVTNSQHTMHATVHELLEAFMQ